MKSITISDKAYARLMNLKKKNESFSEVINRITDEKEVFGILTDKEANDLNNSIKEIRKHHSFEAL